MSRPFVAKAFPTSRSSVAMRAQACLRAAPPAVRPFAPSQRSSRRAERRTALRPVAAAVSAAPQMDSALHRLFGRMQAGCTWRQRQRRQRQRRVCCLLPVLHPRLAVPCLTQTGPSAGPVRAEQADRYGGDVQGAAGTPCLPALLPTVCSARQTCSSPALPGCEPALPRLTLGPCRHAWRIQRSLATTQSTRSWCAR